MSKRHPKHPKQNGSNGRPALVEAAPRHELKLDLGCGLTPKEGFEGVDVRGGVAKYEVDLFRFPWPFEDKSVDEIYASHFLEHIPLRDVEERDVAPGHQYYLGADMLLAFMDECYRIMKPDAWMTITVPSGRSSRAFWDPTHRRFFMQETFCYFSEEWRVFNSLQHYRISTNFVGDIGQTQPVEEGMRSAEVQAQRMHQLWNVTVDWHAKLRKMPRLTETELANIQKRAQEQIDLARRQQLAQPPMGPR